jgi:hypothetical protein
MLVGNGGAIDGYVRQVEQRLPGRYGLRKDLLAELRGGLNDAAAAYRRDGLSAPQAELLAVREAGPADELAAEYRAELVASQGQRTAALIGLTLPAVVLAWTLMWRFGGDAMVAGQWPVSPMTFVLARVVDWAAFAGGAAALVGLVVLVWSARRGRSESWVGRSVAIVAGGLLATHVGSNIVMNVLLVKDGFNCQEMYLGPVGLLGAASMAVMLLQLRSVWRTLRLSFG